MNFPVRQCSHDEFLRICQNLDKFGSLGNERLELVDTKEGFIPVVKRASSGFKAFIELFYKPPSSRIKEISKFMVSFFNEHDQFAYEKRDTVLFLKGRISQQANIGKSLQAIADNSFEPYRAYVAKAKEDAEVLLEAAMVKAADYKEAIITRAKENEEAVVAECEGKLAEAKAVKHAAKALLKGKRAELAETYEKTQFVLPQKGVPVFPKLRVAVDADAQVIYQSTHSRHYQSVHSLFLEEIPYFKGAMAFKEGATKQFDLSQCKNPQIDMRLVLDFAHNIDLREKLRQDTSRIFPLLELAIFLGYDELVVFCEEQLLAYLDESHFDDYIDLLKQYPNLNTIRETYLKRFTPHSLAIILNRDEIKLHEDDILDLFFEWVRLKNIPSLYLEDIISVIRTEHLSPSKLQQFQTAFPHASMPYRIRSKRLPAELIKSVSPFEGIDISLNIDSFDKAMAPDSKGNVFESEIFSYKGENWSIVCDSKAPTKDYHFYLKRHRYNRQTVIPIAVKNITLFSDSKQLQIGCTNCVLNVPLNSSTTPSLTVPHSLMVMNFQQGMNLSIKFNLPDWV